jgi:hypothetical protein
MARGPARAPRPSVAVLEAHRYHEEVLFAIACALTQPACAAEVTVYAHDHRRSREFLHEDLGLFVPWHSFAEFGERPGDGSRFDLIVIGTFPLTVGAPVVERALTAKAPVFALVHDIDYFARPDGVEAALARWPSLIIGYPGPAPARPLASFPTPFRDRITRFLPVVEFGGGQADVGAASRPRVGVGLPGTIEFSRRDFSGLLRLAAQTGIPLQIFGRSRQPGDGSSTARALAADRRRLFKEIALAQATPYVSVSTDLSCRDFYRVVDGCRFIAVMPVSEAYLRGKLTGAVTAAISCGVPMVVSRRAYAFYTGAAPALFSACMVEVDGSISTWEALAGGIPPTAYAQLCEATEAVRTVVLAANAATLNRVMTIGACQDAS